MTVARGLAGFVVAATFLVLGAAPAASSCADDSGPGGSEVIFTGAAVEERRGFTRLQVDEVWAGPDLAGEVWVESGQEQAPWPFYLVMGVSSSVDAEFVPDEAYVVGTDAGSFSTNACRVSELSAATELRPDDVREPTADGNQGADPPAGPVLTGLGLVGLVAALVVGLVWLVRLTRRRRHAPGGSG